MEERAGLVIRPLGAADEAEALAAHAELVAEGSMFLQGHEPGMPWAAYLDLLERYRAGVGLPAGHVPTTTLVGAAGGSLVGLLSVRHRLSPRLELMGGHLGYVVRPAHRRRGYATALLRHGLGVAAGIGVGEALVTCSDDNVGSIAVIERAGGVLRDRVEVPGYGLKRRYLVSTSRPGHLAGRAG